MSRRQADCAEDPKTYHKKLYSGLNPIGGEIKEDRNPGGRMGIENKFYKAFQNGKTIKIRLKNKDFSLLFLFSS
jgi:hypothetical protein